MQSGVTGAVVKGIRTKIGAVEERAVSCFRSKYTMEHNDGR